MRRLLAALTAVAVAALSPGLSHARAGAGAPSPLTIRFDMNPLLECYFFLRTYDQGTAKSLPQGGDSFAQEAGLYHQAESAIQDPAAWHWFEDQVVAGPDPAAIRAAVKNPPPALGSEHTHAGLDMLADGLDAAYPKFLRSVWPDHQRSITRVIVTARKKWNAAQARIVPTLMEKMAFQPVDAPITIFVVVSSAGISSWGKTAAGYYTVVGLVGVAPEQLIETGVHESTHILDSLQSYTANWLLKQVRQALANAGKPSDIDTFIHGLIAYNAGSLVKRFVDSQYVMVGIRAPGQEADFAPYVSTYDVVWNAYLDGKMDAAKTVAKLTEEFKAVRKLEEAKKK